MCEKKAEKWRKRGVTELVKSREQNLFLYMHILAC